ncbi:hypothetical protein [Acanthopleuribacter pedis]|uniref:Uncharacterized protein n=1 Tax=Acanthopleuribacter pedis TaxID=442870 RepID=A0A8J7U3X2_9BACT|nr:hypothetical protein [Acanthopleuribacter pedis]MBO1317721.1 hypothetical protein [Acanthopleuribacter pedis]
MSSAARRTRNGSIAWFSGPRLMKGYGTQAAKFLLYVTRELSAKLLERAEQG